MQCPCPTYALMLSCIRPRSCTALLFIQANETFEELSELIIFSRMWLDHFDGANNFDKIWSDSSTEIFLAALNQPFVRQMLLVHEGNLDGVLGTEERVRIYELVTSLAEEVAEFAANFSLDRYVWSILGVSPIVPLKRVTKNKFDSNNDASNVCENERIFLNLLEFI